MLKFDEGPLKKKNWKEILPLLEDKFPSIKIDYFVGSGNWAKVYKAKYKNKDIALRIEIKRYPELPIVYKTMMNLNHTNVQKIFSFAETDKYLFVIMEFIEGYDLTDISETIVSSKDPIEIKLKIAKGILDGIDFLTKNKIYHRDIKPENIRVRLDGTPVIIDFGAVCVMDKFFETRCNGRKGNFIARPQTKKTPINPKYFYTQSLDSTTPECDTNLKEILEDRDMVKIKNSYIPDMLKDVDIWGILTCLVFLENIPHNEIVDGDDFFEEIFSINGMYPKFPKGNYCEFKDKLVRESEKIKKNWEVYMNKKTNLFYPVYQQYLKTENIYQMAKSIRNLCSEWLSNPLVNPETNRKIKQDGPTFKKLENKCGSPKRSIKIEKKTDDSCINKKCSSFLKTNPEKKCSSKAKYLSNGKCVCGRHMI